MPRVESYGQRRVRTTPLPSGARQAQETFASKGGTIALAEGAVADAQAQFGEVGVRVGLAVGTEIYKREFERATAVQALRSTRELNDLDQQWLHDPKTGLLNQRGKAVMEQREATWTNWDKGVESISRTMTTDAQRQAFAAQAAQRRAVGQRQTDELEVREVRREDADVHEAYLVSQQEHSATNATKPFGVAIVMVSIEDQMIAIDAYAARSQMPDAVRDRMKAEAHNKTVAAAIQASLVHGDYALAKTFLAMGLTGKTLVAQQENVQRATTDGEGAALAGRIVEADGPQADGDAWEQDKLARALRAAAGTNAPLAKAGLDALGARQTEWRQGVAAREEVRNNAVWGAAAQPGMTLARIQRMPEYLASSGVVKNRVVDYFAAEDARAAALLAAQAGHAAAAAGHAAAAEQRVISAQQRAEDQREFDGWAAVGRLMADPVALRALTPGQIAAMLPDYGYQHVARLQAAWEKVASNDKALGAAEIDAALYREVGTSAGLTYMYKTPGTLSKPEAAANGKLLVAVNEAVARASLKANAPLTLEQQRTVMQEVVDRKVMLNEWGTDPSAIAATVTADAAKTAYRPLETIKDPAERALVLKEAAAHLRTRIPAYNADPATGRPAISDERIYALHRDAIARAAAIAALGGTKAQINAALEGR